MTSVLLQAQGGQSIVGTVMLMGGMLLVMYFFMIRPQMKRMKEARKFQEALSVGDKVVTTSGIHGKVVEIGEKDIVISLDQGRMRVEKAAISPTGFVAEPGK